MHAYIYTHTHANALSIYLPGDRLSVCFFVRVCSFRTKRARIHKKTHTQTDDPHRTTPQRSLSHCRHRRRRHHHHHTHTHTHTLVRVCVWLVAEQQASKQASKQSSRREPKHALLAYAQPTKLTPKHETGSSLGHTAPAAPTPVWPAPTRDHSRVGGHKGVGGGGVPCGGDLLN
jgi:hypothetical protein